MNHTRRQSLQVRGEKPRTSPSGGHPTKKCNGHPSGTTFALTVLGPQRPIIGLLEYYKCHRFDNVQRSTFKRSTIACPAWRQTRKTGRSEDSRIQDR